MHEDACAMRKFNRVHSADQVLKLLCNDQVVLELIQ